MGEDRNGVILACLMHLDRTHFIENLAEKNCHWVVKMIENHLVSAEYG